MKNIKVWIFIILIVVSFISQDKKESLASDEVVRKYSCVQMGGTVTETCNPEFEYQERVNGQPCCLPNQ